MSIKPKKWGRPEVPNLEQQKWDNLLAAVERLKSTIKRIDLERIPEISAAIQ